MSAESYRAHAIPPARALATVVCVCTINWAHTDVVGGLPYDFTTGNLYVVTPRQTKHRKSCPASVPHGRIGPVTLEEEGCRQAATERVQKEAALAAAEKRWNLA